jgi:hypothetical protein
MMYSELVHQLHEKEKPSCGTTCRSSATCSKPSRTSVAPEPVAATNGASTRRATRNSAGSCWRRTGPCAPARRTRRRSAAALGDARAEADSCAGPNVRARRAAISCCSTCPSIRQGPEAANCAAVALGPAGTVLRGARRVAGPARAGGLPRQAGRRDRLAIVLSAAAGWLLARRGLAPVRAIGSEIGRINAREAACAHFQ